MSFTIPLTSYESILGPFVGDFESEILHFLPYCYWLTLNVFDNQPFVASHFNRRFLYPFIDDDHWYNVYAHLTRNEKGQVGFVNDGLSRNDFNHYVHLLRDEIAMIKNVDKKNVLSISLPYGKAFNPVENHKKVYPTFKINDHLPTTKKPIFIPSKEENEDRLLYIVDRLIGRFGQDSFLVVGDSSCLIKKKNQLTVSGELVYARLINLISSSPLVLCPAGIWTLISNVQKSNVFSWGDINQYRPGGVYHQGNGHFDGVISDNDTSIQNITNMIIKKIESLP